jgi:hypothetical protein
MIVNQHPPANTVFGKHMKNTKGKKTLESLNDAIQRVTSGKPTVIDPDRKLSISAVAEEAGVSAATIHNRYPEIAAKIRDLLGLKSPSQNTSANTTVFLEYKAKIKQLNEENRLLRIQTEELISRNATLQAQLYEMKKGENQ